MKRFGEAEGLKCYHGRKRASLCNLDMAEMIGLVAAVAYGQAVEHIAAGKQKRWEKAHTANIGMFGKEGMAIVSESHSMKGDKGLLARGSVGMSIVG